MVSQPEIIPLYVPVFNTHMSVSGSKAMIVGGLR